MLATGACPTESARLENEKDEIRKMQYLSNEDKDLAIKNMDKNVKEFFGVRSQLILFSNIPRFPGHYLMRLFDKWSGLPDTWVYKQEA
mgnify:CR=1 FL=1